MTLFNKDDYRVLPIPFSEAKEWVLKKHYAHRVPSISYAFGLYWNDGGVQRLVGVCTFGVPASPSLVSGAIGEEYADRFFELNRLVVTDGLPRNALSFFVATSLKMLPAPMVVVSYADSGMNHHGYIYQATNWLYTGLSAKHVEYTIGGVEQNKHSRHLFDHLGGIKNAQNNGVDMVAGERTQKYRYFQFIGDRRQRRQMLKSFKYPIIRNYPKGDNVRYDASYEVHPNGILF